jgi:hypothetical protein
VPALRDLPAQRSAALVNDPHSRQAVTRQQFRQHAPVDLVGLTFASAITRTLR